jgi:hypothetical protein
MVDLILPGQAMEKAAAEVTTAAGKEITAAFGRRLRAALGRGSARDEALALEDQRNIYFEGEQKRIAISNKARRDQEVLDTINDYRIQALTAVGDQMLYEGGSLRFPSSNPVDRDELMIAVGQAFDEMRTELRRSDLTSIEALRLAEADPESDSARPIDDDWLMNFFKYARDVSEPQVRHVLSRALADAAIPHRPVISPRALDTARFFDADSFAIFNAVARHLSLFGAIPRNYFEVDQSLKKSLGIHLDMLNEMGLIRTDKTKSYTIEIGDVIITFVYGVSEQFEFSTVKLTKIGREIAGLWDSTIRRMYEALAFGKSQLELWHIQQKLGISEQDVKNITLSLISDIGDTWALNIKAYMRRRDEPDAIYGYYRGNDRDEIKLKIDVQKYLSDASNEKLVQTMVDEFDHFNEYTLPNMPERGQSNDFDRNDAM